MFGIQEAVTEDILDADITFLGTTDAIPDDYTANICEGIGIKADGAIGFLPMTAPDHAAYQARVEGIIANVKARSNGFCQR